VPIRPERFFWLHGRLLDHAACQNVNDATNTFLAQWTECPVDCMQTVLSEAVSDRLWLLRLGASDRGTTTRFNKALSDHIRSLSPLPLKRQVTLPTPLVSEPYGPPSQKLDLGLHVVNDDWNGSLMFFLYYQGRYYNPPHLQMKDLDDFAAIARERWTRAVCDCHRAHDRCTLGCWDCFDLKCPRCEGTGWNNFSVWIHGGARIDYSSGWPIAIIN
jgi:hypothetical protein